MALPWPNGRAIVYHATDRGTIPGPCIVQLNHDAEIENWNINPFYFGFKF